MAAMVTDPCQSVLATKYTTNYVCSPDHPPIMANYTGNSAKSLAVSVKDSLKKLQTDYIDLVSARIEPLPAPMLMLFCIVALRPLVGLQHVHSRTHAVVEPSRRFWQSSVPRNQRFSRVGC
jgi:hypothetical protein